MDDDRRVYLELRPRQADKDGRRTGSYGLMSHHVYLVAMPQHEEALAQAVGRAHTGRPLGNDALLSKLETLRGRRGRPRKTPKITANADKKRNK